jgi:thioredoxin 1
VNPELDMNQTLASSPSQQRATDEKAFDGDVQGARVVLVKFGAAWCPPCHALQRTVDAVLVDRPDLVVLDVDVDAEPALAERFGVRALPTVVAFHDGAATGMLVGNQARAKLDALLQR